MTPVYVLIGHKEQTLNDEATFENRNILENVFEPNVKIRLYIATAASNLEALVVKNIEKRLTTGK